MVTPAAFNQELPRKLIIGFITVAATAVIATSAIAGAAPADKPTKEECAAAGFKNYGQCVKEWAHDKNHNGHGYGGDDHHHKHHKHHDKKDKKDKDHKDHKDHHEDKHNED